MDSAVLHNDVTEKITFLLSIAEAFHLYGANAPRLELALHNISHSLDLEGSFYSSPTGITIIIDLENDQVSRSKRVPLGSVNLAKLSEVDELADRVIRGDQSILEGVRELKSIAQSPPKYPLFMVIPAFGISSMAIATLFHGALLDIIVAFGLGTIMGFFVVYTNRFKQFSDMSELISAFASTFCAYGLKHYFPEINFQIVLVASLIVIIPGLGLTISLVELAAKHLVSGTARFFGAMVEFLKIAIGVAAALSIGSLLFGPLGPNTAHTLGLLWTPLAIGLAALSFTVIFNARLGDILWIAISGIFAVYTAQILSLWIEGLLPIFTAALFVGLWSNLFARTFNRPALIPLLPGLIFLVPGSVGFRGINLIFAGKNVAGLDGGVQMMVIAIIIVAGLFFANILINPRRSI